jgi:hypothetical protein
MPIPTQNSNVVGEAVGYLTDNFRLQQAIPAFTSAFAAEIQELENAIWTMMAGRSLVDLTTTNSQGQTVNFGSVQILTAPAMNPVLDTIGSIVGQPRQGLDDSDYLSVIYLKITVNRSSGRTTDWSQFAQLLLQSGAGGPVEFEQGSAALYFFVGDLQLNPIVVASVLARAVANGVGSAFGYSTWPDGNDFEWCDVNNESITGQGTFGDTVAGVVGGLLVSEQGMT